MAAEFDETHRRILEQAPLLRVATVMSQGDPFVLPVRFHFDGTAIYFLAGEGDPQLVHMRANRRVALVAEEPGEGLRGVVVQGLAQFVRGQGEREGVLEALRNRYPKHEFEEAGGVLVKVTPLHFHRIGPGDGE